MSQWSNTDTSDDEEQEKLRSAIDPSFSFSIDSQESTMTSGRTSQPFPSSPVQNKDSKEWDPGHAFQTFQITPETKNFIAKRLQEALDSRIEVEVREEEAENTPMEEESSGIYLFSNSDHRVSGKDIEAEAARSPVKTKKRVFKKRKLDNDSSEDERSKLKSVAVSSDWVMSRTSM